MDWSDEDGDDGCEIRASELKPPETSGDAPVLEFGHESWIEKYLKTEKGKMLNMSGEEMYQKLSQYCLSLEDMMKLSFPIPRNDHSVGIGTCDSCEKKIFVDVSGKQVVSEVCVFHSGNFQRKSRAGTRLYDCCPIANPGCQRQESHLVTKTLELPEGFVKTSKKQSKDASDSQLCPRIFAIDAEMCDICVGNRQFAKEIVQLAVVDCVTGLVVYKEIVRPEDPIHNYNTFVHGLKKDQIDSATTTVSEMRKIFLDLVSEDCILVGHDIKSDLRALKVIHYKIVETQHVFPDPRGDHNRFSLRFLLKLKLNIEIDSALHDPADDAFACMFLIHTLLKEAICQDTNPDEFKE